VSAAAYSVPEREHVLVHKLLLEGAEREYLRRANRLIGHLWCVADDAQVEVWMGRHLACCRSGERCLADQNSATCV